MEDTTVDSCNPTGCLSKWKLSQFVAGKWLKNNAILDLAETISDNSDSEFSRSNDSESKSCSHIVSAIISSLHVWKSV